MLRGSSQESALQQTRPGESRKQPSWVNGGAGGCAQRLSGVYQDVAGDCDQERGLCRRGVVMRQCVRARVVGWGRDVKQQAVRIKSVATRVAVRGRRA